MEEIKKMIAYVQVYIHHRKGVEVQVAIPRTEHQLHLLVVAYKIVMSWFGQNGFTRYVK